LSNNFDEAFDFNLLTDGMFLGSYQHAQMVAEIRNDVKKQKREESFISPPVRGR